MLDVSNLYDVGLKSFKILSYHLLSVNRINCILITDKLALISDIARIFLKFYKGMFKKCATQERKGGGLTKVAIKSDIGGRGAVTKVM